MSEWDWQVSRWLEELRQRGSVIVPAESLGRSAEEWREAIRCAARRVGLRIRTGVASDGSAVWAFHVDHVVTEAQRAAALDAVSDALEGREPRPWSVLVERERRRRIRPVE